MKIRGLLVAALVLFVLGGLLYWSNRHKPGEDIAKASASAPTILKLDQSSINHLEVEKKDSSPIQLTKAPAGSWEITEPTPLNADQDTVTGMLSTLSSLNAERLVEDKAADLKRFGLEQPSAVVSVGEKGQNQKLLFGDQTPTGGAVYVKLAGDPRVFTVATYTESSLDKNLNDLRDKRLITLTTDKISRIELARKGQNIEFGREKDEWQILKPKPMRADSLLVGELAEKLADARMDLTGSENAAVAYAHGTPVATAKVTGESGVQQLKIRKDKDSYYAESSVVQGAYKVASDLGQALDKTVDDFRNKKIFDFGFNQPNKVELHFGSKAYFLTRSGQDWWSDGKKMDADTVEPLISQLRDLAATKFPDTGFSGPSIEAIVTSDDGKRIEKVSIAKSGKDYLAKRENDPALYELDPSAMEQLQKAADSLKPTPAPKK